jgi:hypothetical protein
MISCAAIAIGIHLGTYHFERDHHYNEFNPGAYAACDGYVVGVYQNSVRKTSTYVGYQFSNVLGPINIVTGVVTGYKLAPVVPMIIPTVKWDNIRVSFIPPIKNVSGGIHLSMEFK